MTTKFCSVIWSRTKDPHKWTPMLGNGRDKVTWSFHVMGHTIDSYSPGSKEFVTIATIYTKSRKFTGCAGKLMKSLGRYLCYTLPPLPCLTSCLCILFKLLLLCAALFYSSLPWSGSFHSSTHCSVTVLHFTQLLATLFSSPTLESSTLQS